MIDRSRKLTGSSWSVSRPALLLVFALSVVSAAGFASSVRAQGGITGTTALVPNADALSFRQIRLAERKIAAAAVMLAGDPSASAAQIAVVGALGKLQQVHDATYGRNHVTAAPIAHPGQDSEPVWRQYARALEKKVASGDDDVEDLSDLALQTVGDHQVYVSVTDYLIDVFHSLPESFQSLYRQEFDLTAQSALDRAFASGSARELWTVARRYPISSAAPTAAVLAGDLFYEAGEMDLAARAWDAIHQPTFRAVHARATDDSLPLDGRLTEYDLTLRQLRVAAARQDVERYTTWSARLSAEQRAKLPSGWVAPEGEQLPWVEAARDDGVPAFDFDGLARDVLWKSVELDATKVATSDVPLLSPPVIWPPEGGSGAWIAVNSFSELLRFDLESGLLLQKNRFPLAPSGYREVDPLARLKPVVAELPSDRRRPVMIGSYVRAASKEERYAGYKITEKLPTRALYGARTEGNPGAKLWDTSDRSIARRDPLLASLSFNADVVVQGDRVYALGWRQAGYVEAFLVCLDLETGEALWKSLLVGNQIELTMFGEIAFEPFLGELLVHRDRIFASTNLGVVAAVHAHTGDIEWISPYPTEPVRDQHPRRSSRASQRSTTWERNPMVRYRDRLYVTPLDSSEFLGFDLETGQLEVRVDGRGLGRYFLGLHEDQLVFADFNTVTTVVAREPSMPALARQSISALYDPKTRRRSRIASRPALVRGGIIYTVPGRVGYRSLRGERDETLFEFTPRRGFGSSPIPFGNVMVVGDRVLVANTVEVSCYRGVKR